MTSANAGAGGDAPAGATRVSVVVPNDLDRLPVLRSIATAVAVSADFDIDTVADFRMAVDEMVSAIVGHARPDGAVTVEFLADGNSVTVRGVAAAADPAPVDEDSFGWRVLSALVDTASVSVGETASGDSQVRICLVVTRPDGAP